MKSLTRAQFARQVGVTRQSVGRLVAPGGRLHGALEHGRIDLDHPSVLTYLAERERTPMPGPRAGDTASGDPEPLGLDDGTSAAPVAILDMRLRDLMQRFGGVEALGDWIKVGKLTEEWRSARLKNEENEGLLIQKAWVESSLLSLLEEQNLRLLNDVAKAIARIVQSHGASGMPLEDSEREIRGQIGKTLDATKARVVRQLRRGEPIKIEGAA